MRFGRTAYNLRGRRWRPFRPCARFCPFAGWIIDREIMREGSQFRRSLSDGARLIR